MNILTTKLHRPAPHTAAIPRPHLTARLEEAAAGGQRLILLSAPAGFGKSTLVTQWLRAQHRPVGWLSLDAGDQQVQRFLLYLVHACQRIHPEIGAKLVATLQSTEAPPVESVLVVLINDVTALGEDLLLVLEDYHEAAHPDIDRVVTYLLDNAPPNLTLVITTRVYPDLSLSRLRVRGQLLAIQADDLRFSTDEVRHLLNQKLQLALTADQVRALHARTEGWAAGLQLAALSLETEADRAAFIDLFSGSHRYVTDYLTEEVLRRQSAPVQRFLLHTAVLDRLCAPLCDALLNIDNSAEILAYLDAHNLFVIPLDHQRAWYRYHHLFAELLRQRLQRDDPGQSARLLKRASAWCLAQGEDEEAVTYALAASDMTYAAEVLTPLVAHFTTTGRSRKLRSWLDQLPAAVVEQHAALCLYYAIACILQRHFDRVEPLLDAAERAPHGVPAGYIDMARALYDSTVHDGAHALEMAHRVLDVLPPDAALQRSILWLIISTCHLMRNNMRGAQSAGTRALDARGDLSDTRGMVAIYHNVTVADLALSGPRAAARWITELDQYRQRYEDATGIPMTGTEYLLGMQGMVAYERNELALAEQYCLDALDALQLTGEPYNPAVRDAYLTLVRVALAKGDGTAAQQWHDALQQLSAATYISPLSHRLLERAQVEIWIADRDRARLQQWIDQRGLSPTTSPIAETEADLLLFAQWQPRPHTPDALLPLLDAIQANATEGGRRRSVIRALALRAVIAHRLDQPDRALALLHEAADRAEAGGFVRTLLDMGAGVADLLRLADQRSQRSAYAQTLLAALAPPRREFDTLSARELQVLHLIAAGKSNSAIAAELVIAPGTVKRHTANIYEKLYVNNRTAAVARAREQGLLA